jgi:ubiquinone/menaquinone biosynthesis C-methylase UbiE
MPNAAQLAQRHWNETPLHSSEGQRYGEYPWLYEAAEFRKHAGEKVLEVGCGTGTDLLQFAKHGAVATGVDLASRHVDLACARLGDRAKIYQADMRRLPFADNSFDYVYSHGVLHHSDQSARAVREMFRVLRPGGRINIHVYAFWSYFTLWRFLRYGTKWKSHIESGPAPVHIDLYTERKLRQLFASTASIEKHQCKPFEFLAPWLGWFLVVKDQKPFA